MGLQNRAVGERLRAIWGSSLARLRARTRLGLLLADQALDVVDEDFAQERFDDVFVCAGFGSVTRVLDRHAARIARRAAPFGRVPVHFEDDDLAFELPVEFRLSD